MKTSYIITGTSSGIGQALAEKILQDTNSIVLGIARRNNILHDRYMHQSIDFTKMIEEEDLKKITQFIDQQKAEKIILINNAGVVTPIGQIGTLSNTEITAAYFINVIAPFILINHVISLVKSKNLKLQIVNIGTGANTNPIDGWSAYCSTKASLKMLTEVGKKEFASNGEIEFTEFSPGVIDTPMQSEIRQSTPEQVSRIEQFRKFKTDNKLESPADTAKKIFDLFI